MGTGACLPGYSVIENEIIKALKGLTDEDLERSVLGLCKALETFVLSKLDVAEADLTEEQKDRLRELCLDRIYGHLDSPLSEYKWTVDQVASPEAIDVTGEE